MKNLYNIQDEITVIFVKRKEETHEVFINTNDLELISSFNGTWHLDNRGYVKRANGNKTELLHRVIMNADEDKVIDHINGNKLDNRRDNLRIITRGQNAQNITSNKRSKTGIRGVSLDTRHNLRWKARVRANGKDIFLGHFDTKEEAIAAVEEGRKKHLPYSREAYK